MKVQVKITLDIPDEGVEAWMTEYGLSRTSEVREDVRQYLLNTVQGVNGAEVAGWTATLR